jgi:Holliday junction resolvase
MTEDQHGAEKGRRLEAEVARALAAGGYAARRNVVREGRSGAHHEIDVLADKSDGLTTFTVMVECKAWDRPVDKEVLAKAAFVAADVGADKTIVVALRGATGGAALSAAELGVELWGPEELERRLGHVQLAALGAARAPTALGFAVAVEEARAVRLAERQRGKGILGLGAEEVAWFGLVWLPCLLLTLGCTRLEGRLHKRTRHSSVFNLYEALDGALLESFAVDPAVAEVEVGPQRLPPLVKPRTLRAEISSTFEKWRSVVQGARGRRSRHTSAARCPHGRRCHGLLPAGLRGDPQAQRLAPGRGDRRRRRRRRSAPGDRADGEPRLSDRGARLPAALAGGRRCSRCAAARGRCAACNGARPVAIGYLH